MHAGTKSDQIPLTDVLYVGPHFCGHEDTFTLTYTDDTRLQRSVTRMREVFGHLCMLVPLRGLVSKHLRDCFNFCTLAACMWSFVVLARGTHLRLVGCGKYSHSHCITLQQSKGRRACSVRPQSEATGRCARCKPRMVMFFLTCEHNACYSNWSVQHTHFLPGHLRKLYGNACHSFHCIQGWQCGS